MFISRMSVLLASIPRMASEHDDTRTVSSLRNGTKICLLVAIPFIVAAVYYYFAPAITHKSDGGVFNCGSAASPPTDQFPKNVCSNITDINLYRAYALAAAGILIGLLGFVLFGADRHVQTRRDVEREDHYAADHDREEDGHAPAERHARADHQAPVERHARAEDTTSRRRRRWEDDNDDDA